MRRNRELALFEDDFEMRRHADVTLRLQQISTTLIREGSNGAIYHRVLDAAIELMSAHMGSMQVFHQERGELRLLAQTGFHPESAAYWEMGSSRFRLYLWYGVIRRVSGHSAGYRGV
jgi:hypothetical protein